MTKPLQWIRRKIKKWTEPRLRLQVQKLPKQHILGTDYGGYTVPEGLLHPNAIYYSVGAGEDISLDIEIANRYNPFIFIFDPTERAERHFAKVKSNAEKGIKTPLYPNYIYPTTSQTFQKTMFEQVGLWIRADVLKFFAPAKSEHVSHSLANLQNTENYVEVPVDSLDELMKRFGHKEIDMLKMDIEGSEFEVIDDIISKNIAVKYICLEYHRIGQKPIEKIQTSIDKLINNGYICIAAHQRTLVFAFLRADVHQELRKKM
jgi:FkbM family methyltransferase